jgi:hypothetical protein
MVFNCDSLLLDHSVYMVFNCDSLLLDQCLHGVQL